MTGAADSLIGPFLLLGADGMLGRAWSEQLCANGQPFDAPGLDTIDFTNETSLSAVANGSWKTVINCGAYTDVDGAESDEAGAMQINGRGVGTLANACKASGALLVHYSTDYVFDGLGNSPYPPAAERHPIGVYGMSKALGEELIEQSGCEYLIIRTSWLYAPWGKNFVLTMVELTSSRPELRVVDDQIGRPTSALHLARVSLALVERGRRGIWHATDGGSCSWFEFAREICIRSSGTANIEPCTTAEFPRPAPRPAYSVLDLSQTEELLGPMPDWRDNLDEVLNRSIESTGASSARTHEKSP